jgi:hypothetical protein
MGVILSVQVVAGDAVLAIDARGGLIALGAPGPVSLSWLACGVVGRLRGCGAADRA